MILSLVLIKVNIIEPFLFKWMDRNYEGRYESDASTFFSENVTAVILTFTLWFTHLLQLWGYFSTVSAIFNILLPTLIKTLYTNVVKFPASTHHNQITQTLFQFVVICKMSSTQCITYMVKQAVVGGCQVWAVSRMGKNSPSHFCDCLKFAQAGVRLSIVMKEKGVLHVSVRPNSTDELSQFV
jgi:hypothetical protein